MNYRCPKCKKPLTSELDIAKLGIEPTIGYFIESAVRTVVASGRSTYWACTNPECGCCFGPGNKFWFKINTMNLPVPKSFIARELGIWPKPKKKKKKGLF